MYKKVFAGCVESEMRTRSFYVRTSNVNLVRRNAGVVNKSFLYRARKTSFGGIRCRDKFDAQSRHRILAAEDTDLSYSPRCGGNSGSPVFERLEGVKDDNAVKTDEIEVS